MATMCEVRLWTAASNVVDVARRFDYDWNEIWLSFVVKRRALSGVMQIAAMFFIHSIPRLNAARPVAHRHPHPPPAGYSDLAACGGVDLLPPFWTETGLPV